MIVQRELCDCRKTRHEVILRQGLRLVEDYHAVGDVVQLPAAAAAVGVQRFKKLHGSRHDDRRVPVLAGEKLAVLLRGEIVRLR